MKPGDATGEGGEGVEGERRRAMKGVSKPQYVTILRSRVQGLTFRILGFRDEGSRIEGLG
jgi:hypothetical protein